MEKQRELYRRFAAEAPSLPLFAQPWWLDATCGPVGWGAAVLERGGRLIGGWPYFYRNSYGIRTVGMPTLTPSMGPHLLYPASPKQATKLTFEHEAYGELLKKLPAVPHFSQYMHYSVNNLLPCLWQGFQASTRYTYILKDLSNTDSVFANFKSNIKTDIRKAMKISQVVSSEDPLFFWNIYLKTFERQNRRCPVSQGLFERLDHACQNYQCRKIFLVQDEQQRTHAAAYIVWDNEEAYYLMGGADPALRNSGAGSLVVWHAIQFAALIGRRFNFEGSMLPTVEPFFRAFGGAQIPYFHITRTPSRLLRLAKAMFR